MGLFGGGSDPGEALAEAVMSIYKDTKKTYAPYVEAGKETLPMYQEMAYNKGSEDPYLQYYATQGMSDLDKYYASRGLYNSGTSLKGTSDFLANLYMQGYQQKDKQLANLINWGLGGAGGTAQAGSSAISGLSTAYSLQAQQSDPVTTGIGTLMGVGANVAGLGLPGAYNAFGNSFSFLGGGGSNSGAYSAFGNSFSFLG